MPTSNRMAEYIVLHTYHRYHRVIKRSKLQLCQMTKEFPLCVVKQEKQNA